MSTRATTAPWSSRQIPKTASRLQTSTQGRAGPKCRDRPSAAPSQSSRISEQHWLDSEEQTAPAQRRPRLVGGLVTVAVGAFRLIQMHLPFERFERTCLGCGDGGADLLHRGQGRVLKMIEGLAIQFG